MHSICMHGIFSSYTILTKNWVSNRRVGPIYGNLSMSTERFCKLRHTTIDSIEGALSF